MNSGGSGGLQEVFPENSEPNQILINDIEKNGNPNRSEKDGDFSRRKSQEDHDNKISDIPFPVKNEFIEFGDNQSNPDSVKNPSPSERTSDEKIDFNLTKKLDTEDLQSGKVNPMDEYGKTNGNYTEKKAI